MNHKKLFKFLDNLESYLCQIMLSFFVVVLFMQIFLRVCFDIVIPWSEEISRFSFVWFVFLGAAYAARLAAHNRVTIQFKMFPKAVGDYFMLFSDCIWCVFNVVMIVKSFEVIEQLGKFKFFSPALQWSMEYVYWIFPISFSLMTIRIIQVNYIKFVLKQEIVDVDHVTPDQSESLAE